MRNFFKKIEDWLLIYLLGRIGDQMSYGVFSAVAERFVMTTVILMVLQKKERETYILLTQRDLSDNYWAGLWDIPGTVIRKSDNVGIPIGSADPIARLEKLEIQANLSSVPKLILTKTLEAERGKEVSYIYVGTISEKIPPCGKWFNVNELPQMVSSLPSLIKEVMKLI